MDSELEVSTRRCVSQSIFSCLVAVWSSGMSTVVCAQEVDQVWIVKYRIAEKFRGQ